MPEAAIADPPRFRWLKRGTMIGVSVIVILSGVRWWWGWAAQRRLDALVAATHAYGEPILPEDFKAPPFASGDNAAPILLQSAAAVQWPLAVDPDPQTPEGLRTMWEIGQMNVASRRLARAARDKPYAYWGARASNLMTGRARPFNSLRSLANLLATSAQGEQAQGNDLEAIELLRDLLREGCAIDDRPDDLITHLVAAGVDSLATDTTVELSQSLRFAPATSSSAATAPTTPAVSVEVRALIADLMDEQAPRESAQWYWHGEAAGVLDMVPTIASQTRWFGSNDIPRALYWIVRPMFEIDTLNLIGRHQITARASAMENFPAATAFVRGFQSPDYSRDSDFEQLTMMVSQSLASPTRMIELNDHRLKPVGFRSN